MKQSTKIMGAIAMTGLVLLGGTTSISAHGWGAAERSTLIQRIVDKFKLKTADVQEVFDTVRKEHQLTMQQKLSDRLDALVKEGTITQEQKDLILAKHAEMQTQREQDRESMKDLTPEERRAKMEARRTELENWAKTHGIDTRYLIGFGRGMHTGGGWGMGGGWR